MESAGRWRRNALEARRGARVHEHVGVLGVEILVVQLLVGRVDREWQNVALHGHGSHLLVVEAPPLAIAVQYIESVVRHTHKLVR